ILLRRRFLMSGCVSTDKHSQECLCDAVRAIKHAQDSVERSDDCDNNCFDLLGSGECNCHKHRHRHDTIPFFLQNNDGVPFFTAALKDKHSGCEVILTPFFRVSKIKGCCATLELLEADFDGDYSSSGHHSLAMFSAMNS